ncbi:DUF2251 domain-containing protein [Dyella psychrodurans]|uniref:DUF2251 domain-containing protein n=1 Tax=Dyella psychrodurans TaxID=1927960 RepID=A0A370X0P1_9GAMM|nr:DUF2251 domain-containing protein [Dyella psychrodurans]RDS81978.1 DUF2251 domain-containing protein [Dyella psychrodurans]
MTNNDIFESQVNSDGSRAGVYEHDDDVGYFYLYDLTRTEGQKVTAAIRVSVGPFRYSLDDLAIRWSGNERFVGLFIKNQLCAVFDAKSHEAFGGESEHSGSIPESIKNTFKTP